MFPEDCVRSIVRLVFKKGDRADLKNWRPISLLNLDYKIIARALSGRLKGVLVEIISEDQTCGIVECYSRCSGSYGADWRGWNCCKFGLGESI